MNQPEGEELAAVLAHYGLDGAATEPIAGGLINRTHAVRGPGGAPVAVAQRLHPIFDPAVNLDIDAITARLRTASPCLLCCHATCLPLFVFRVWISSHSSRVGVE